MLSLEKYDHILSISMSQRFLGREVSRTYVYLVDGLLIDTGLPKLGSGLVEVLGGREIRLIVNTYDNLESVGNNALLQRTFSIPIKAHKEAIERIKYPRREGIVKRFLWGQPLGSKVSKLKSIIRFKDYHFRVSGFKRTGPGFQTHPVASTQDSLLRQQRGPGRWFVGNGIEAEDSGDGDS